MPHNNTFDDSTDRTVATIERNRDRAWAKIALLLTNQAEISDNRVGEIIQEAIALSVSEAFSEANILSQRLATETERRINRIDSGLLRIFAKSSEMEEFFNQDAELQ
jgi:hypothetical protein